MPKYEITDPRFSHLILPNAELEILGEGFRWLEGPVWFADPPYGFNKDYEGGKQVSELPANVYRLEPDSGELERVAGDFTGPNGLCFSPDESKFYVTETEAQFTANPVRHIRVFTRDANGKSLRRAKLFCKIEPSYADGICYDVVRNISVYTNTRGAVRR